MNEQKSTAERDSPAGLDYLSEIIKSISASTPPTQQAQQSANTEKGESNPSSQTAVTPDLISALLSNPELIAKLPSILATVKPIIEMLGSSMTPTAPASATNLEDSASAKSESKPVFKGGTDRRETLLCAMKPYLSHDRCQAIDYIIKLSHLGAILKTL